MPEIPPSPLSEADMNLLEAFAGKANARLRDSRFAPFYLALDPGDASHPNGYIFLCWPAHNHLSDECAQLIFEHIGDEVNNAFGAVMVTTAPEGQADGPQR